MKADDPAGKRSPFPRRGHRVTSEIVIKGYESCAEQFGTNTERHTVPEVAAAGSETGTGKQESQPQGSPGSTPRDGSRPAATEV